MLADRDLGDTKRGRNQIEFVNLIINELTKRGVVEAARVYETPYDGVAPEGPEGPEAIFTEADLDKLFATLEALANAAG